MHENVCPMWYANAFCEVEVPFGFFLSFFIFSYLDLRESIAFCCKHIMCAAISLDIVCTVHALSSVPVPCGMITPRRWRSLQMLVAVWRERKSIALRFREQPNKAQIKKKRKRSEKLVFVCREWLHCVARPKYLYLREQNDELCARVRFQFSASSSLSSSFVM